jgi:hypothetical protein
MILTGMAVILGLSLASCRSETAPGTEEKLPPIRVTVGVDRPTINVGDLINYTIHVDSDSNILFNMPQFAENLGGFVIRDWKRPKPRINDDGRREQEHTYVLETYLTGNYELPPAHIRYRDSSGTNVLSSTPVCVEVITVAEEGDLFSGIRDIKEPVELAVETPGRLKYWIIAISAAVVAIAAITLLFALRRKREAAPAPPVPAHERAYEALRRLHALQLVEQGRIKEYYFELSIILRHYIENRFGLRAPEQTTEEFLQSIKSSDVFSSGQRRILKDFLKECDLVKFANYSASPADAQRAHDVVVAFIEETRETEANFKRKDTEV